MPLQANFETGAAAKPSRSHALRVVGALGLTIVSGSQPEGSLLPGDQELMARYGVSRTVLREAFKTLAAKGMVQARARVGTRVTPKSEWNLFDADVLKWHAEAGLTPEFFNHLAEMRNSIEPEVVAFAALRRTEDDISRLREWLDLMARPGLSREDFARADLGFHLAVADAAHNPLFVSLSGVIEVVLMAMLTISSPAEDSQRLSASVVQHQAIFDAILRQDADAAREAIRVVVRNGIDNVRRVSDRLG